MKNNLFLFVLALFLFASCREKEPVVVVIENAVTDYDGNTYNAVQIGKQVWMKENLRTTHYADGTPLGENDYYLVEEPFNAPEEYGYLYIDKAAALGGSQSNDASGSVQGVCPDGWHLPSRYEWLIMSRYVEQFTGDVVGALCATVGWGPDTNGIHNPEEINSFAFSALPSRKMEYYSYSKPVASFWTSTVYETDASHPPVLHKYDMAVLDYYSNFQYEFWCYGGHFPAASVRCVRNE